MFNTEKYNMQKCESNYSCAQKKGPFGFEQSRKPGRKCLEPTFRTGKGRRVSLPPVENRKGKNSEELVQI